MRHFIIIPALVFPLIAFACGSSSSSGAISNDASTSDVVIDAPDASISDSGDGAVCGGALTYPGDATITFRSSGGGFVVPGNDASTCSLPDDTFTYDIATANLTWKLCQGADAGAGEPGTDTYVMSNRTLGSAEVASLLAKFGGVKVNCSISCGADKPEEDLTIDSPSALAPETFIDQFYHCSDDGKQYVDGLDAVETELRSLAK